MKSLWIIGRFSDNTNRYMVDVRRSSALITALLLAALIPLAAQSPDIFSPFPSSLRARPAEGGVILTWRDSPDILESYRIFRHTEEIRRENFDESRLVGSVPPGTETFTDYPEEGGEYFYLVLVENPEDGLFELFIPFRNKTVYPVNFTSVASEEELATEIDAIRTEAQGDSVRVSFSADRGDRSLMIYRHTSPILSVDDLLEASRIAMIESDTGVYTDYPIPGIQYYYGIFDTKLVQTGTFRFRPNRNITTSPVKIAAAPGRNGLAAPVAAQRTPPLPRIRLQRGIKSGELLVESLALTAPSRRELFPDTAAAVQALLEGIPEREYPDLEAEVLPEHLNGSFEGAAYTLSLILQEQFLNGDFSGTARSLESFLSIRRDDAVESAARYYLGQAYYFEGEYRKAFYEFLIAEERYYPEAQNWIDDIYRRMRKAK
jgi:hypothetical protein